MELAQLIRNTKEDEPVPHIILISEFCSLEKTCMSIAWMACYGPPAWQCTAEAELKPLDFNPWALTKHFLL